VDVVEQQPDRGRSLLSICTYS